MLVSWAEMPRSPGHVFYDRLQSELVATGFDGFVEGLCAPHYAARRGRPSLPPGRYFRMLLVGYFEGIDSERGLEWRCADSLSLREFLRLREPVPDHSWLSRTRARLPPLLLPRAPPPAGAGAGSLLAEPPPRPPAARGARRGVQLGAAAPGR